MAPSLQAGIATVRAFNRRYTNWLGLLERRLDNSVFTLSEARVLYELANRVDPTAAALARDLRMDRAQISRTLKRFSDRGLLEMRGDPAHGRQQLLTLTGNGRSAFVDLDARTQREIGDLLGKLAEPRRNRLLAAAGEIARVLDAGAGRPAPTFRGLRPGDLGMVTARQAILYSREYGWNQQFEVLVARILADFTDGFDPARDDAWIAEIDGEMVGSVFLVRGDEPRTAKLRLLYVEPSARDAGVGGLLVSTCVERARALGYSTLSLWTNSVLVAARKIYERAAFVMVDEAAHRSFGRDLVGQTWTLRL